ncbi:putative integrase-like protein [Rhizobium freirei PRF 81]|uniref:Putative integrase-like protein n=1 Tax=Rhizobium freirei PRF 81 TaxID=363754 RepID=N6UB18_9HYPH|nr:putative integrase-like protein [Rhizobium freirei PRF 81]
MNCGGLDPEVFSAHGLRAGYLTGAASRSIPLQEAMRQSLHKSVTPAASCYNNAERKKGRAARPVISQKHSKWFWCRHFARHKTEEK